MLGTLLVCHASRGPKCPRLFPCWCRCWPSTSTHQAFRPDSAYGGLLPGCCRYDRSDGRRGQRRRGRRGPFPRHGAAGLRGAAVAGCSPGEGSACKT
eukprot:scaffold155238_cov39-Prasinocladus_malaysianus.AAC.1